VSSSARAALNDASLAESDLDFASIPASSSATLAAMESDAARAALRAAAKRFNPLARFELRRVGGRLVVFDGAHNPAALETFLSSAHGFRPGAKLICVAGAMKDKDLKGLAALLRSRVDPTVFTRPASYRAADPSVFAAHMHPAKNFRIVRDPLGAFKTALKLAGPRDIVAVCGSFYLIADIKACLKGRKASFPKEMLTV